MDHHLLRHLRQPTEMLVGGGPTYDELLAADVSRGGRRIFVDEDDGDEACTPKGDNVGRNFVHCARHFRRKPWATDSHLMALFEMTVWHTASLVQTIDRRHICRHGSASRAGRGQSEFSKALC